MLFTRPKPVSRLQIARSLPPASAAAVGRVGLRHVTTATVLSPPAGASGGPRTLAARHRHRPLRLLPMQLLQARGKKTKTVVKLDALPQGVVAPPLSLQPEEEEPAYPTVVLQARRHMQKFDDCVLLTRVGGFYELYLDQADEIGPLLNLKVVQKKTSAGPVSMVLSRACSVPPPCWLSF